MKSSWIVMLVIGALVFSACGGDGADETTPTPGEEPEAGGVDPEALVEDPEAAVEELAEGLEELQEEVGGGGANLTVGNQTWTFDGALCAFGEEQIGQEGAEFNMSAIQDGLQLYASIDSFGHSVSLNDIEDFENPSVSLDAFPGDAEIVLDGKNVTATASFVDGTTDSFEGVEGMLEATCP